MWPVSIRGLVWLVTIALLLGINIMVLILVTIARSEPLPVPSTPGGICPSGYSRSPTSGYCTPNPGTRNNAVPQQGYQACPPGWHSSMGSFCVKNIGER
jgi:hypothetical protein